jgi:hypothetical protein
VGRVLVARVERLQGQVKNMSSRIKELEAALADSQAHAGKQQHPLLAGGVKWEEADDAGLPPESDTDSVAGAPYDDNDEEYSQQANGEVCALCSQRTFYSNMSLISARNGITRHASPRVTERDLLPGHCISLGGIRSSKPSPLLLAVHSSAGARYRVIETLLSILLVDVRAFL